MFIVWGKKRVTTFLGYVADFCPICRSLQMFKIKRIGIAGHLYYVSFGEGELAGHIRTCAACNTDLNARPENYKELGKEELAPFQLASLTFPNWAQAYAARLAVEKELSSPFGKLPSHVRQALIREPFELLSPKVETRFASSQIDGRTTLAVLAFFVLLGIATWISEKFPASSELLFSAAVISGLSTIGVAVYQIRERFFREKVIPQLSTSLRPLKPTAAELDAALNEMKSAGHKIGKKLKLKWLLGALQMESNQ